MSLPSGPLDQLEDLLVETQEELDNLDTDLLGIDYDTSQELAQILESICYTISNAINLIRNIRS